ncbi:hypothetical protein CspeluHIS016_0300210 [Cutaneotrichosporon spelunceum]|uniref:Uncharacterized protein n=1 Tax=Cutaneotrichosporon spelunceum TaxID=1672016 RepID=A0AAD3YAP2_9TREE|nr:hypothetical protein CspeluHIS016_0300210 [Cutaneotrichosporon spelunceum]
MENAQNKVKQATILILQSLGFALIPGTEDLQFRWSWKAEYGCECCRTFGTTCQIATPSIESRPLDAAQSASANLGLLPAYERAAALESVRCERFGDASRLPTPLGTWSHDRALTLCLKLAECERCSFLGCACSLRHRTITLREVPSFGHRKWAVCSDSGAAPQDAADMGGVLTLGEEAMVAVTDAWEAAARVQFGTPSEDFLPWR